MVNVRNRVKIGHTQVLKVRLHGLHGGLKLRTRSTIAELRRSRRREGTVPRREGNVSGELSRTGRRWACGDAGELLAGGRHAAAAAWGRWPASRRYNWATCSCWRPSRILLGDAR